MKLSSFLEVQTAVSALYEFPKSKTIESPSFLDKKYDMGSPSKAFSHCISGSYISYDSPVLILAGGYCFFM